MTKNKKKKNSELVDEVEMFEEESSLSSFTKRSLPTDEEVEKFDRIVHEEIDDENRDEEVDNSLNEIYQDDDGKIVDVKKLYIKKRHGFIFWFFSLSSVVLILFSIVFYFYENYFLNKGTDATAVEFSIKGDTEVTSGEEYYYTVNYNNLSNVNLSNVTVELSYPENFIFIDSDTATAPDKNNIWKIDSISPYHTGKIKIKGKIISETDSVNVAFANLNYTPDNFSSNFLKESSITTIVDDIGLNIDFDYISTALVGEENEIFIKYNAKDKNYTNDFRIVFNQHENIKIIGLEDGTADKSEDGKYAKFDMVRPGVWRVNEVLSEFRELVFKFDFNEKLEDHQELIFDFEKKEGDKYMKFYEKKIDFEVMKSDLNLTLIINGSRENQGINAGDSLNYSIVYNNKGETNMSDVVIMAVIGGELVDWSTLVDTLEGVVSGNTISWTKEQIPSLGSLAKHEEGTIDFSLIVKNIDDIVEQKTEDDFGIKSYIQFSVGKIGEVDVDEDGDENVKDEESQNDNQSNTIINKINSNLSLKESVRYFSEDNIPVGIGPHPPKVGEETKYRVYWDLTNTLHELNELKVEVELPAGISWGEKDTVSVGTIVHDDISSRVVWNIGRLPSSVREANAQFDISVNPNEDNKDKIMILLPGSKVSAIDKVTESQVGQTTKAKTTKLMDDDIAIGDGVVE
jgi:uncharacterized repeat protein (TIGR01451 family)